MRPTAFIETLFRRFLPSPFSIALLLTALTFVLALIFTEPKTSDPYWLSLLGYWEQGIWQKDLLVFAYQMMLILVLGHMLVLSPVMSRFISALTTSIKGTTHAVILVSVLTMLVSFFNWGLGLIFGALMARKIGEAAIAQGIKINYPLVGAAAYAGMMIWHGGISGSAPAKVGEQGHLASLVGPELSAFLPDLIAYTDTVFSVQNVLVFLILLLSVPLLLVWLGRMGKNQAPNLNGDPAQEDATNPEDINLINEQSPPRFIETNWDESKVLAYGFGLAILIAFFYNYGALVSSGIVTPNMLNFLMLGLIFLAHGKVSSILKAVDEAISGASGILIQFPLYFGIMGVMQGSGLVEDIANYFVALSTAQTLPILTFVSAAIVNVFIPSGGGQWAIQGPVILEAAISLKVPVQKVIMALAYGDQLTNMLQPFWALPLLGITKLKASELLPYTLWVMVLGAVVFVTALIFW
ncbi:TIGR00366 family protein [Flavobacteriaceae bacterium]|nr:TIGR00366 family protein [Flavobacteriaceae bacterium]